MIKKTVKFSGKNFKSNIVKLAYKCNFCEHKFEDNKKIENCPECNSVDLACKEKKSE